MASRQITIQLRGSKEDGEHVRLPVFLEQLDALKVALQETERAISGRNKPSVYYRVVDLRHSSPARITVEATTEKDDALSKRTVDSVVARMAVNLRMIGERQQRPKKSDVLVLEAYRDLGTSEEKHLTEVTIFTQEARSIQLNQKFQRTLESIIGPDETALGSVSGYLETLNLHQNNRFAIYPTIGPRKVTGIFPRKLRNNFKAALDRFVTVEGTLSYKGWDSYPYYIKAEQIAVHPFESDLPPLNSLWGIAPMMTDGLTAEEFVRRERDENW